MTALKFQLPDLLEWIETDAKLTRAVKHMEMLREGLGPDIDFAVDFHAGPARPWRRSSCARSSRFIYSSPKKSARRKTCAPCSARRSESTTPLATGERLIAAYGFTELIDLGVVDVLQPDIAHVGGITALWKVAALAEAAGIRMAPHACEGPIGGIASLHVDAAIPNFLAQEICGVVRSRRDESRVGGSDGFRRPCAWWTAAIRCRRSRASVSKSTKQP